MNRAIHLSAARRVTCQIRQLNLLWSIYFHLHHLWDRLEVVLNEFKLANPSEKLKKVTKSLQESVWKLIKKDKMKELLGHSPDYLDMLLMGMYWEMFGGVMDIR